MRCGWSRRRRPRWTRETHGPWRLPERRYLPLTTRSSITTGKRLFVTVPTFPSSGSDLDSARNGEKSTDHAGGLGAPLIQRDFCWLNPAYAKSIPPEFLASWRDDFHHLYVEFFPQPEAVRIWRYMFTSGLIRMSQEPGARYPENRG